MLLKGPQSTSDIYGGKFFHRMDQLMDRADEVLAITGIPDLLKKVERTGKRTIATKLGLYSSAIEEEKKAREAEEKDPERLRYWMKRHQEQSRQFLYDEK